VHCTLYKSSLRVSSIIPLALAFNSTRTRSSAYNDVAQPPAPQWAWSKLKLKNSRNVSLATRLPLHNEKVSDIANRANYIRLLSFFSLTTHRARKR